MRDVNRQKIIFEICVDVKILNFGQVSIKSTLSFFKTVNK